MLMQIKIVSYVDTGIKKKIDKFKESMIKISIFGAFNIIRKEYNDAK